MPNRYAADATEQILRDGGNAIDAGITAAFVLAVTYPEAGNIGGGGFMTSYMDGEAAFLDFREHAPMLAYRDMYLDEHGEVIPNASLLGGKAVGVPGTVKGMQAAHKRYGSLPWATLLQPAITLAKNGFTVPPALAEVAAEKMVEFDGVTNFKRYFGGMRAGENFKQAELAATLERIAVDPSVFYSGDIARQIVAQMERSGGLITMQDLTSYEAQWRAPLRAQWRDFTVLAAPPPSSGGFALIQLLMMRDYADRHFQGLAHNSAPYIHLLAEIEKRVFADRAEYLGDPDYIDVPMSQLLDETYLAQRASEIKPKAISPTARVPPGLESTDTIHFSILDHEGNAVSLTYTLNWEFGSGEVVEGAGFLLNNEMDDFSAKPGVMNKFGVVGNTRNAIEPGKRMLSSMTPTILLKDNKPTLVIGTPGGSTIFTSVFQVILNLYDYDMPLQTAVDATRFHHQLPEAELIRHDQREIPEQTQGELEKMGYTVEKNSWGNLGRIESILINGPQVQAATDSRGRGDSRVIAPSP
jgi:gamma-glutamyltranspeptidase/glutathione hydrolase